MSLSQQLSITQSQSLNMTQQMQMAVKLLQFSSTELQDFVEEQLLENPLLMRDGGLAAQVDGNAKGDENATTQPQEQEEVISSDISNDYSSRDEALDADWGNMWEDAPGTHAAQEKGGDFSAPSYDASFTDSRNDYLDRAAAQEVTLKEHVMEQIPLLHPSQETHIIAAYLTDMLDERGYIDIDFAQVAGDLQCEESAVQGALELLQRNIDPSGIFARNPEECLMLQAGDGKILTALIRNLEAVAEGNLPRLSRICGSASQEEVEVALSRLRELDPKPGMRFGGDISQTLIPDIWVSIDGSDIRVELNQETLPKVLVSRDYYSTVRAGAHGKDEKQYISEQYNHANWLVRALDQRANTMLRVATELMHQQRDFLFKGVGSLRPMGLKDIAAELDIHESTVSRITTRKYIATPRGTFEMKFFFSSGISSVSGEAISSASVKQRIKRLIEGEDGAKPLSDDKISSALKLEGMQVARRTVAKYREAMNIPSSSVRRR